MSGRPPAAPDSVVAGDGRLALRRWSSADAAWYAAESTDPEIQRFTTDPPDLTPAQVSAAIEAAAADPTREAFLVVRAGDGMRLGNLAVGYEGRTAALSYWIAADARGTGVAAGALALVCDWLARAGRVEIAQLWTHADNVASRRSAERAGFERDPGGDRLRTVKGVTSPTVAYARRLRPETH